MEDREWLIRIINDPTISDEEKFEIMEDEGFDLEDMYEFVLKMEGKTYAAN